MRLADPVHNVELRRDHNGHPSVVFAFPYRPDMVDAVRAIPGRRFDWQAREWWALERDVADGLLELAGARLDPRALRCAPRLQVGQAPAPATLTLVESYGEPRFKLEVNWDPDTVGAFAQLPAAEAHGRTVPLDPYLLEPLEFFIRTHGIDVAQNALVALDKLRIEHDAAIGAGQRSRAADGDVLAC